MENIFNKGLIVKGKFCWLKMMAGILIVFHLMAAASLAEAIAAYDPCDCVDQIGSEPLEEDLSDWRSESDVSADACDHPVRIDKADWVSSLSGAVLLCYRFAFLKACAIHAPPSAS